MVAEGKKSVFQSKELPIQTCFYKYRMAPADQFVGFALFSFLKEKDNARK